MATKSRESPEPNQIRICPFRTATKVIFAKTTEGELIEAGQEQYFPECYEKACPLYEYEFVRGYYCKYTEIGGINNDVSE